MREGFGRATATSERSTNGESEHRSTEQSRHRAGSVENSRDEGRKERASPAHCGRGIATRRSGAVRKNSATDVLRGKSEQDSALTTARLQFELERGEFQRAV